MEKLLLINPARRRKSKKKSGAKKRHHRKAETVTTAAPTKRRRYHRNPVAGIKRRTRRYKRNPISGGRLGLKEMAMPALQGAAGGLALDFIIGLPMVPASLKTGPMKHLVKGAVAVGIGMVVKSLLGNTVAVNMARGALTVAAHDAGKEMLTSAGVNLAGVGYYPANELAYAAPPLSLPGDISNGYNGY